MPATLTLTQAPKTIDFHKLRVSAHYAWIGKWKKHYPILTAPAANAKIAKSEMPTYSVFLSPADSSDYEVCPWRTNDCTSLCLNCSGKGGMSSVQTARVVKTRRLMEDTTRWFESFYREVFNATQKHSKIALRLNGTSDLPWEAILPRAFFEQYRDIIRFYDYTKSVKRASAAYADNVGIDLTLSYSGQNFNDCIQLLRQQACRVAVVFDTKRGQPLPEKWHGFDVIDGDLSDARFLDPRGVVVGLRYKPVMRDGKWIKASDFESEFVVRA